MKFKYNLEKVLRHREILESLAQKDFQEALGEHTLQKNALDKLYQQEKDARASLLTFQENSRIDLPQQGIQLDHFLKLQALRIETQKTKVETALKRVEEKREILRQTVVDRKILDKHKEQKRQLFMEELNRKEQLEADELTSIRFVRRGIQETK